MSNIIVLDIETAPKPLSEHENYLLEYKLRNYEKGSKEWEEKKISLIYSNPVYTQVIAISVAFALTPQAPFDPKNAGVFFSRTDERYVIESFMNYIKRFPYSKYIHYNGLDFDVPILLAKSAIYGIEPPPRFCNTVRFRTDPHYDIMQVFTNWGRFRSNLRELLHVFGISDSKEYLKGLERIDFMVSATDEEIQKYSFEDIRSTYLLFQKVFSIYQ